MSEIYSKENSTKHFLQDILPSSVDSGAKVQKISEQNK